MMEDPNRPLLKQSLPGRVPLTQFNRQNKVGRLPSTTNMTEATKLGQSAGASHTSGDSSPLSNKSTPASPGQSQVPKISFPDVRSLVGSKGETCTLLPFTKDKVYFGSFSDILVADFSRPNSKTQCASSTNWIFDISCDFRGRLLISEGFGFVKVITSKKEIFTIPERVHTCRNIFT